MSKDVNFEAEVTSLNSFGDGLLTYQGLVYNLSGIVPGDTVLVKLKTAGKKITPELVRIVKPSPSRADSNCEAFEAGCGGCKFLNLKYSEQLVWKAGYVEEILNRRAGLGLKIQPVIGMENPTACRNKMSLLNQDGKLVFMQENSRKTIEIENCPQETAAIQEAYEKIKKMRFPEEILQIHIRSSDNGKIGICFFVKNFSQLVNRSANHIMKELPGVVGIGAETYREYKNISGRDFIETTSGSLKYRISLNGFFQTNYPQAEVLLKLVQDELKLTGKEEVLDLYCGAGFFSLALASKAKNVVGIENNAGSIRAAIANAKNNKIGNAYFKASDVLEAMEEVLPGKADILVLDPPREGCETEVVQEILRIRPKTILYISCSPESLARDLLMLTAKAYKVLSCRPVDMFPQTAHVETVVKLVLR